MRDLTLQSKRNVSIHGLQKRLEADEVALQTPISGEEQEVRILPTGQVSREAMRVFRKILETAGLPVIRFHDLRHSAATILLSMGVNLKVIQERLGHANVAITLGRYSHVTASMQNEANGLLNQAFQRPADG